MTSDYERALAELAALKTQLSETNAKLRKVIEEGFPPISTQECSRTLSSTSHNKKRKPAQLQMSTFGILTDISLTPAESCSWPQVNENGALDWTSESDLQGYVKCALKDVIKITGLQGKMKVLNEMSAFTLRPDICVFRLVGRPIGVCEVKKPNNEPSSLSALDDQRLDGQIYDYMLMLRNFTGLQYVFGIITTYDRWRICWLPDTDHIASATSLADIPPNIAHAEFDERLVKCSRIYRHNEPELVKALCSVLHKMNASPMTRSARLIDAKRYYLELTPDSYAWLKLKPKQIKLSYVPPPEDTTTFIILDDYHGGGDGKVWLACSPSGSLVVIKFGSRHKGEDETIVMTRLEAEAKAWRDIWDLSTGYVRVVQLNGYDALVMPFAFHGRLDPPPFRFLTPNHWAIENEQESVRDAVDEVKEDSSLSTKLATSASEPRQQLHDALLIMMTKGYRHDDLEWRHVAMLPVLNDQTWSLRPILIDLSRISKLNVDEEKDKLSLVEVDLERMDRTMKRSVNK